MLFFIINNNPVVNFTRHSEFYLQNYSYFQIFFRYGRFMKWAKEHEDTANGLLSQSTNSANVLARLRELLTALEDKKTEVDSLVNIGQAIINDEEDDDDVAMPIDMEVLRKDVGIVQFTWQTMQENITDKVEKIGFIMQVCL